MPAAVPSYLAQQDFSHASPALRFGPYFDLWKLNWSMSRDTKADMLKKIGKLNPDDKDRLAALVQRQQALAAAIKPEARLSIDALAIAPFTTGLGNEHPLENGFAFLNPYGLPYLPASGIKGVLRQAARELASGVWGNAAGWSKESCCSLTVDKQPISLSLLDVLFGKETREGEQEHVRGVLTFWDVIPQIKEDANKSAGLQVEVMTPHQTHYYQKGETPHDSGQPNPIYFLTVPPGSGFNFHVTCDLHRLAALAPALLDNHRWKTLLEAAFAHAFTLLGFGAKTAVGYGAMAEDAVKKAQREEELSRLQEQVRRSTLSPEDLAYEEHQPIIKGFRSAFEIARKSAYQPGQEFDSKRNDFIKSALAWDDQRSRLEAATLLDETVKWGVSKKGKDRIKSDIAQLKGAAE